MICNAIIEPASGSGHVRCDSGISERERVRTCKYSGIRLEDLKKIGEKDKERNRF